MIDLSHHDALKSCPFCGGENLEEALAEEQRVSTLRGNHIEFMLLPQMSDLEARAKEAEAMLPLAYRAGLEAGAREAAYYGAIQHKADGSYAGSEPVMGPDVADAIRTLPTHTSAELLARLKEKNDDRI